MKMRENMFQLILKELMYTVEVENVMTKKPFIKSLWCTKQCLLSDMHINKKITIYIKKLKIKKLKVKKII